jgi:hypothetical protein
MGGKCGKAAIVGWPKAGTAFCECAVTVEAAAFSPSVSRRRHSASRAARFADQWRHAIRS